MIWPITGADLAYLTSVPGPRSSTACFGQSDRPTHFYRVIWQERQLEGLLPYLSEISVVKAVVR